MTQENSSETIEERLQGLTLPPPPPPPKRVVGVAEGKPDKNYDKLTMRLPFAMKVTFERLCSRLERTPSAQARILVSQFIEANKDKLD